MITCPKCGAKASNGSRFCSNCGAPLSSAGFKYMRRAKKGRALAAAIVLIVIVLGIGGFFGIQLWQQQQSAQFSGTNAHEKVKVRVVLNISLYMPDTDSFIPISVSGADLDGELVQKTYLFSPQKSSLKLMRGTYQFQAVGSPATLQGHIYDYSTSPQTVVIDEKGITTDSIVGALPTFTYTPISATEITDAQIDAVYTWMIANDISEKKASSYKSAIEKARAAGLVEAGMSVSSAEASEYHVTGTHYQFDIPQYWWGKVNWKHKDGDEGDLLSDITTVYLEGNEDLVLAEVCVVDADEESGDSDLSTNVVGHKILDGAFVELISINWAWREVQNDTHGATRDELKELVDLSSGGSTSYEKVKSTDEDDVGTFDVEFLEENMLSTITKN